MHYLVSMLLLTFFHACTTIHSQESQALQEYCALNGEKPIVLLFNARNAIDNSTIYIHPHLMQYVELYTPITGIPTRESSCPPALSDTKTNIMVTAEKNKVLIRDCNNPDLTDYVSQIIDLGRHTAEQLNISVDGTLLAIYSRLKGKKYKEHALHLYSMNSDTQRYNLISTQHLPENHFGLNRMEFITTADNTQALLLQDYRQQFAASNELITAYEFNNEQCHVLFERVPHNLETDFYHFHTNRYVATHARTLTILEQSEETPNTFTQKNVINLDEFPSITKSNITDCACSAQHKAILVLCLNGDIISITQQNNNSFAIKTVYQETDKNNLSKTIMFDPLGEHLIRVSNTRNNTHAIIETFYYNAAENALKSCGFGNHKIPTNHHHVESVSPQKKLENVLVYLRNKK